MGNFHLSQFHTEKLVNELGKVFPRTHVRRGHPNSASSRRWARDSMPSGRDSRLHTLVIDVEASKTIPFLGRIAEPQ